MGEDEAPRAAKRARAVRHVGLEIGPALADQMVADVDRASGKAAFGRLARALDSAQGDPQLPLAGPVGQVLHRLAVAVAAQEVHLPYTPAGSRCSTPSTRLTASKYWLQSSVDARRRLVMTFATETCAAAWR